MHSGFAAVLPVLRCGEPTEKCRLTRELGLVAASLDFTGTADAAGADIDAPGRPPRPLLVAPQAVPRRRLGSSNGRAALVHAVAHIEFNAINLALDAAWRFSGMPAAYYRDWISVAVDEARHFELVRARLLELGHDYGDFPAHDGLWEMAERTSASVLERMALVPRVLEARGLDVTPGMIERLREAGDAATVEVLEVILAEEVRHVAIGTHWFRYCCAAAGKEPEATFLALLEQHFGSRSRGPYNLPARRAAGFSEGELAALHGSDSGATLLAGKRQKP